MKRLLEMDEIRPDTVEYQFYHWIGMLVERGEELPPDKEWTERAFQAGWDRAQQWKAEAEA